MIVKDARGQLVHVDARGTFGPQTGQMGVVKQHCKNRRAPTPTPEGGDRGVGEGRRRSYPAETN